MFTPLILEKEKIILKKNYIKQFKNKKRLFRSIVKNLITNIKNTNKHIIIRIKIVTKNQVISRLFNIINTNHKLLPQLYYRFKGILHLLRNLYFKLKDLKKILLKLTFFNCNHS